MNKNPFSIYDFLGYLFPGLVALMLLIFCFQLGLSAPIEDFFRISTFSQKLKDLNLEWWEKTTVIIVLSYISGHIVAYLSSVLVELFANKTFGYPSEYLLQPSSNRTSLWAKYFAEKFGWRFLWKLIVFLILFPVSFPFFILGKLLHIVDFIVRPLDDYLKNGINKKFNDIAVGLGLNYNPTPSDNSSSEPPINTSQLNNDVDKHRVVMHYVYLNIPNSQRKADNYIAIYGFLRAITLIACVFYDFLLLTQLISVRSFYCSGLFKCKELLNSITYINWKAIFILFCWQLFCNVLFMGFVKFYRRFTLENYMSLLTGKVS